MKLSIKTLVAAVALATSASAFALDTDIATGRTHTLFVGDNGSAYFSGAMASGAGGDMIEGVTAEEIEAAKLAYLFQSKIYEPRYMNIDNVKTVDAIAYVSAILLNDGTVYWLGYDYTTRSRHFVPVEVVELAGASDISLRGGTDYWDRNFLYAVVDGVVKVYDYDANAVHTVTGIPEPVVAVDADTTHALFLTESGALYASGNNEFGSLGNNTLVNPGKYDAVAVVTADGTPLTGVTKFSAGEDLSMAIVNGKPYSWGKNRWGTLGDGTSVNDVSRPYAMEIPYEGTAVDVTTDHATLILGSDGSLGSLGWTNSNYGCGYYNACTGWTVDTLLTGVSDIYVTNGDTWFVTIDNTTYAWSGGHYGQMAAGEFDVNGRDAEGNFIAETHVLTLVKDFVGGPVIIEEEPTTDCKPGNGLGDKNHVHCGVNSNAHAYGLNPEFTNNGKKK